MSNFLKRKRNNSSSNFLNKKNKVIDNNNLNILIENDSNLNILKIENLALKSVINNYEINNKKIKSNLKEIKKKNDVFIKNNDINEQQINLLSTEIDKLKKELYKYRKQIEEIDIIKQEKELLALSLNNLKIDEESHIEILNKDFYTNYIS